MINLVHKHAAKWIIAALVLVLIIANAVINAVVAANIVSTIEDINEDLEDAGAPPNFLEYEDLSYSFLSSTITLEDVEIGDGDKFDFRAEEIRLKFNKSDFQEVEALEDLADLEEIEISELLIGLKRMRLDFDNDVEARADQLEFEFKGTIANLDKDPELLVNYLVLVLKETEVGDDKAYMAAEGMELVLDSDEEVNVMELDDLDKAFFRDTDRLEFYMKMEGFEAPSVLSRELDLDGFGIGSIAAESLMAKTRKNGDEVDIEFGLNAEDYGVFNLEASFDFSDDEDDPYMDMELQMEDLDRKLNRLFRDIGFESDGEKGYTFEYEGLLSEIEGSLSGF